MATRASTKLTVAESYSALGLQNGDSIEQIKSSYKTLALRNHPDRNPDPSATATFQRISEAYTTLSRHHERSSNAGQDHHHHHHHHHGHPHSHAGFGGPFTFHFPHGYDDDDSGDDWATDDDEDDMSDFYDEADEDGYGQYEDEYDDMDFFKFLFEELMAGRAEPRGFRTGGQTPRFHVFSGERPRSPAELPSQARERMRRAREEKERAEERRQMDLKQQREKQQQEREAEKVEATKRRKEKAEQQKANKAKGQAEAEKSAKLLKSKKQTKRSAVFEAARKGDGEAIKKGIWEDDVDATGGEIFYPETGIKVRGGVDGKETLLHLAVKIGDADLVEWVVDHGGNMEERDSAGYTPFHRSILLGNALIVKYFLGDLEDPEESFNSIPESRSPISLATLSGKLDVVLLFRDKATLDDLKLCWKLIEGKEGTEWDSIRAAFKKRKGFKPPPPSEKAAVPQTQPPAQPQQTSQASGTTSYRAPTVDGSKTRADKEAGQAGVERDPPAGSPELSKNTDEPKAPNRPKKRRKARPHQASSGQSQDPEQKQEGEGPAAASAMDPPTPPSSTATEILDQQTPSCPGKAQPPRQPANFQARNGRFNPRQGQQPPQQPQQHHNKQAAHPAPSPHATREQPLPTPPDTPQESPKAESLAQSQSKRKNKNKKGKGKGANGPGSAVAEEEESTVPKVRLPPSSAPRNFNSS